jgi:hypothetical protein
MNVFKKYMRSNHAMLAAVVLLYSSAALVLQFMFMIDPNMPEYMPDRLFAISSIAMVLFVWSIIELTRDFTLGMVYQELKLDDSIIEVIEEYIDAKTELHDTIHRMTISEDEIALIQQYRIAVGDPRCVNKA